MATKNELFLDAIIRRQIYGLRYSGHLTADMVSLLDRTESDLERQIVNAVERIAKKGFDSAPVTTARVLELRKGIGEAREAAFSAIRAKLKTELPDLAQIESSKVKEILDSLSPSDLGINLPQTRAITAAANSLFNGAAWPEWLDRMQDADKRRLADAVSTGILQGETTDQIVKRALGSAALKWKDGQTQITRNGAKTLSRTVVNHVSNAARREVIKANADLFDQELYVATLDSRTTPICRSLDGQLFNVGEGPLPPLHWNCRSTRVPFVAPLLGDRASQFGPVPASLSYGEWLKKQTKAFQTEILGETRAKLFREGGLALDRFNDETGRLFTLDALKLREPVAWSQAFGDDAVIAAKAAQKTATTAARNAAVEAARQAKRAAVAVARAAEDSAKRLLADAESMAESVTLAQKKAKKALADAKYYAKKKAAKAAKASARTPEQLAKDQAAKAKAIATQDADIKALNTPYQFKPKSLAQEEAFQAAQKAKAESAALKAKTDEAKTKANEFFDAAGPGTPSPLKLVTNDDLIEIGTKLPTEFGIIGPKYADIGDVAMPKVKQFATKGFIPSGALAKIKSYIAKWGGGIDLAGNGDELFILANGAMLPMNGQALQLALAAEKLGVKLLTNVKTIKIEVLDDIATGKLVDTGNGKLKSAEAAKGFQKTKSAGTLAPDVPKLGDPGPFNEFKDGAAFDALRQDIYNDFENYPRKQKGTRTGRTFSSLLADYRGSAYRPMNSFLRDLASGFAEDAIQMALDMKDLFDDLAVRMPRDFLMKRGVREMPGFTNKTFEQAKAMIGATIDEGAFWSTSTDWAYPFKFAGSADRRTGSGGVLFEIKVKSGTPVVPGTDYERELILRPGNQYLVTGVRFEEIKPKTSGVGAAKWIVYEVEIVGAE